MKKNVNLEQIRARNALSLAESGAVSGKEGGEVIKKIPPLIMNHGLLATAAFAFDEKNRGFKKVFDAIAAHLADPEIGVLPEDKGDLSKMMGFLTDDADSVVLRNATNETMAWLSYARRFVKKNGDME